MSIQDIENEIFHASIDQGSLVIPGSFFLASKDIEQSTLFFRATYAAAPFDKIDAAIARFGDALTKVFGLDLPTSQNGHGSGQVNGQFNGHTNGQTDGGT
jgi:aromatic amino acid aminotransferase I